MKSFVLLQNQTNKHQVIFYLLFCGKIKFNSLNNMPFFFNNSTKPNELVLMKLKLVSYFRIRPKLKV